MLRSSRAIRRDYDISVFRKPNQFAQGADAEAARAPYQPDSEHSQATGEQTPVLMFAHQGDGPLMATSRVNKSWRRARRCKRPPDRCPSRDSFSDHIPDNESEPYEKATGMRQPTQLAASQFNKVLRNFIRLPTTEIEFETRGVTVYPLSVAASTRVIENPSARRGFSPSAGIASERRDGTLQ